VSRHDLPAVLGGPPVRTRPFPAWPVFGRAEEDRLVGALRSGRWGRLDGTEVAEFERRFAALHGCRHGIAVVNGTVSLRIALLAAGIQADDEVVVPAYTFVATATAVVEANAIPVFADIDPDTFNVDSRSVEAVLTARTRAIVPVHFAGLPADMDSLTALARERDLTVVEDAAHAHGASRDGRPAGSLADVASFSFQSSKNVTAGEGGIITTNDERLAEACRSIHNCGRVAGGVWYEHHVVSGNYRMGEFQGAVLNGQLDRLEAQAALRDRNGLRLAARLSGIPGLHPQRRDARCTRHSYHLFLLRLEPHAFGLPRTEVLAALAAEGIPCSGGYGFPLPQQPLFRNKAFGPYLPASRHRLDYREARCPTADLVCREQAIWLEHRLMLGSPADVDDVADAFEKIYEHRDALQTAAARRR
jgi:dTDP-4-amino-4,6-dideoxygalactose transaminase